MSSIWNKPLNRETFDDFFHLFAPAAFRSSYRILGDSTRTENALVESFMEVYQKRNVDEDLDLVFLFSDLLQKRVELLAAQYPLSETSKPGARSLDEFTENEMLEELHRRIDSAPFRIVEAFTSSATTIVSSHSEPLVSQIKKTGVTLLLLIQLVITAAVIAFVAYAAGNLFGVSDLGPKTPAKQEISITDSLVLLLDYLPLRTYDIPASDPAIDLSTSSLETSPESPNSDASSTSDPVSTEDTESATVSATRG